MIDSLQYWVQNQPMLCTFLFALYALLVGSVLSMMIYRIPLILKGNSNRKSVFNLFLPRSHCVHCKKTIPAYYNIPLFSYLFLKGRCYSCRAVISWRYPTVEALTLILSLLTLYIFGWHGTLIPALAFVWICICLSFIDLEHQLLPDNLTLSLLWIGLLVNTQSIFCTLPNAVWSAACAYLILWILIKVYYLFTKKIGMGHGDFKLFAAFGAWFGWTALTPILLIASTLGIVVGSIYLWRTKQTRHIPIPFGPYLCVAGVAYLLFPMLK